MFSALKTSVLFLLVMTLILGVIYPVTVMIIGQGLFKYKANGSLIINEGKIVGSELIGQKFSGRGYFYSRPSYAGEGYDATASGASNLAISNNELVFGINQSLDKIRRNSSNKNRQIPADLVEGSASGLDPHISIAAAYYQIPRIALERKISGDQVRRLIDKNIQKKLFGIIGENKVNVLLLNLQLDDMIKNHRGIK